MRSKSHALESLLMLSSPQRLPQREPMLPRKCRAEHTAERSTMRCSNEFRLLSFTKEVDTLLARFSLCATRVPRRPRKSKSTPPPPLRRQYASALAAPPKLKLTSAPGRAPATLHHPRRPAGPRGAARAPRPRSASAGPAADAGLLRDRLLTEQAAHASTRIAAARERAAIAEQLRVARMAAARSARDAAISAAAASELAERLKRAEASAVRPRDAEHARFARVRASLVKDDAPS